MTDQNLIAVGAAVTFIAVGGAYVYLREVFTSHLAPRRVEVAHADRERVRQAARARRSQRPGRAA